ncbi:MAG: hypothetical protein HY094_01230 [Candidatus Melainabacteria bacterium]|nr:hypothetical protein [Candidatus Melainabacteria bacterium]
MYSVYGLSIDLEEEIASGLEKTFKEPDIRVLPWDKKHENITDNVLWYHDWHMIDGHVCLRAGKKNNDYFVLHFIDEKVDFAISPDSKYIYYKCFDDYESEAVKHILFTQVLPKALNLSGIEALHASSVLSKKGVLVFIGKSGFGKSTITAGLIKEGLALLSDNVVPIFLKNNEVWTSSGTPHVGLWPEVLKFLNPDAEIDDPTEKCRITLSQRQYSTGEYRLSHIYFLNPSENVKEVSIEPLSAQESLVELLQSSFRLDLYNPEMLKRQFSILNKTTEFAVTKKITYEASILEPGKLSLAILSDMQIDKAERQLICN